MSDLDLLRSFLAAYRAGTLTRAASELHLTQPAVSMQLRALEARMGRQLLTRLPRGVVPTPAGMELAQAIASHIDALDALLRRDQGTETLTGTVRLGGPEELLVARVVPALAPLVRDGLRLRLHFDIDAPVVEQLISGELDIAVTTGEWRDRGLDGMRLCHESLVLVADPTWAERLGSIELGRPGAEQLQDAPIVAYDETLPLVSDYWRTVFGTRVRRRASVVANGLRAVLRLVERGAGVTVLPEHACEESLAEGRIVRIAHPSDPPRNQLWIMWRPGVLRRPVLGAAHERIVEAARVW